ncbi:hypothetical protein M33023_02040 [Candidatus Phytoplasma asteris]|uniref:Uncharacterized protein n=1 Tax=Candidatus Phytoplasma asteris TaxID=85620 RepID=A0ABZ2YGW7_9MOLU
MAIHFFKTIQTFILNTVVLIGDLFFKIVLRILDNIFNCFKILFIFIEKGYNNIEFCFIIFY